MKILLIQRNLKVCFNTQNTVHISVSWVPSYSSTVVTVHTYPIDIINYHSKLHYVFVHVINVNSLIGSEPWYIRHCVILALCRICELCKDQPTQDGMSEIAWNTIQQRMTTETEAKVLEAQKLHHVS